MNTKTTALDAYLARAAAIHIKLARLQQLTDDHFGHDPEAIHWGHLYPRVARGSGASSYPRDQASNRTSAIQRDSTDPLTVSH